MTKSVGAGARWRALLVLAGFLVFLGTAARAEGDGRHDDGEGGNAPATAPPLPANNIVACFGAISTDPLLNCPGGITSVLQSVNFGVTVPAGTGSGTGGAGAGKAVFSVISFTKKIDGSSQTLFKNAVGSIAFPSVSIGFYDTSGKLSHTFLMRLVYVESVNFADTVAPGGEPVEQDTLRYGAMSANF